MKYYWELRSKNAQNIKALMCPLYTLLLELDVVCGAHILELDVVCWVHIVGKGSRDQGSHSVISNKPRLLMKKTFV